MTEILESAAITEAVAIIDRALSEMHHRELVSSDEVSDVLLDVRTLLTSTITGDLAAELDQLAEPISSS